MEGGCVWGVQEPGRRRQGAGCPEAMENRGFVFSLSAWKDGKEERGR